MLKPQKFKFKKIQNCKKKRKYTYQTSSLISHNLHSSFFFFVKESGLINSKQLDMGKKFIQKILKNSGVVIICIFPQKPISGKPIGVRIGKGKGVINFWAAKVIFGQPVFEIKEVDDYNLVFKIKQCLSKRFSLHLGIKATYK